VGKHRDSSLKFALITTTVHVPKNLHAWTAFLRDGDLIVVAGDLKTPHEEVIALLDDVTRPHPKLTARYLSPTRQDTMYPLLSELTGWNTIQRRNFATLYALQLGADVIITVDDDNWPTTDALDHADEFRAQFTDDAVVPLLDGGDWYNPCHVLLVQGPTELIQGAPQFRRLWHRGFPRWLRESYVPVVYPITPDPYLETGRVGVVASLWLGDPDVDALDRHPVALRVNYNSIPETDRNVTINSRTTWAPFNSQATAFRAELAPALLYWPHVGRYDDIWASFIAQKIMSTYDLHVSFGHPVVEQQRGEHTERDFTAFLNDLENEIFGMRHNREVVEAIRTWTADPTLSILENTERLFYHVATTCDFIPDSTVKIFDEWLRIFKALS